jgi:hypothetical protein
MVVRAVLVVGGTADADSWVTPPSVRGRRPATRCLINPRSVSAWASPGGEWTGGRDHVCGDGLFQRWKPNVAPGPWSSDRGQRESSFCLDLRDGYSANGAQIQIWTCEVGNNHQLWRQG